MNEFEIIQQENLEWVRHNFGPEGFPHRPLLGMMEELGETTEAAIYADRDFDDVYDGMGDIIVFLADYCNTTGLKMQAIWEKAHTCDTDDHRRTRNRIPFIEERLLKTMIAVGKAAHSHLKRELNIRGDANSHAADIEHTLCQMLLLLESISDYLDHPFPELALKVWRTVRSRDWKSDPIAGGRTELKAV